MSTPTNEVTRLRSDILLRKAILAGLRHVLQEGQRPGVRVKDQARIVSRMEDIAASVEADEERLAAMAGGECAPVQVPFRGRFVEVRRGGPYRDGYQVVLLRTRAIVHSDAQTLAAANWAAKKWERDEAERPTRLRRLRERLGRIAERFGRLEARRRPA